MSEEEEDADAGDEEAPVSGTAAGSSGPAAGVPATKKLEKDLVDLLENSHAMHELPTGEKIKAKKDAAEKLRKERQQVQMTVKKEQRKAKNRRAKAACLTTEDLIAELRVRSALAQAVKEKAHGESEGEREGHSEGHRHGLSRARATCRE